jgi:hypothetical protein
MTGGESDSGSSLRCTRHACVASACTVDVATSFAGCEDANQRRCCWSAPSTCGGGRPRNRRRAVIGPFNAHAHAPQTAHGAEETRVITRGTPELLLVCHTGAAGAPGPTPPSSVALATRIDLPLISPASVFFTLLFSMRTDAGAVTCSRPQTSDGCSRTLAPILATAPMDDHFPRFTLRYAPGIIRSFSSLVVYARLLKLS